MSRRRADPELERLISAWRDGLEAGETLGDETVAELEDHLRELIEEELAATADREQAVRSAAERLGDAHAIDVEFRSARKNGRSGRSWAEYRDSAPSKPSSFSLRQMPEQLHQDIRLALRQLALAPGFTVIAVLTLALGIGANSAIFSLTRAALFRSPTGVAEPDRLVAVWTTCRAGDPRCSSSYPDYIDYRERSTTLEDLTAFNFERASLGDDDGARLIFVQGSSGNYFGLLGLRPAVGRLFDSEDDRLRRAVAVLSHDLWRERYGADPQIVGQTIRLNRVSFEVVGVAPDGFRGLSLNGGADVYIPMLAGPALASGFFEDDSLFSERGSRWIDQLIGRLAPGTTIEQARAEMAAISDALAAEDPDARGPRTITVDPAARLILPIGNEEDLVRFVSLLAGVVGLTLVLACANLANLLLARGTGKRREIVLRRAIGASNGRLVRQLLTESLVLALLGGGAAILVGGWLLRLLGGYRLPGGVAIGSLEAEMSRGALLFTMGLAVATGIGFGLLPALQSTRGKLEATLRDGARGSTAGSPRARGMLVMVQVALCLVLLVGASLFLQALWHGLGADLGFPADGLAVANFDLSLLHYGADDGRLFLDTLVERVEELPGVTAAGVGSRAPLLPGGTATLLESVEGYQLAPDEELRLEYSVVGKGFFRALGVPLIAGRTFDQRDLSGEIRHLVINRDMAERWFPDRDPVGGRVTFYGGTPGEIVGVVENTKWDDGIATDAYPFAFLPFRPGSQAPVSGSVVLLARTESQASVLLPMLRDEIRRLDPDVGLIELQTMEGLLDTELMPQRMGTVLLTCFGLLALMLAAVGIYGVVGYTVSRQARDLGIRIALGAARSRILAHVMGGVLVPVALGLLLGAGAAFALSGTLVSFMYDISPTDPLTFVIVGLALATVAGVASLIPALRALRVDPVSVLTVE